MSEIKEVQIRRRETANYLPAPITANSTKYLSSVYSGQGPLRGIEGDIEKKILSDYLGMDVDEDSLPRAMREFWADMRVPIPQEGKTLNISTDDNDMPYNPMDYITFKFAEKHPHVADNEDEMLADSKKQFYIYDFEEAVDKQNRKVSFKKKAYSELIKIGEDEEKIDRLIRLLTDTDPKNLTLKSKQNELDKIIEADPKRFYIVATDKDLEIKAIISEMVTHGVINKYGNQYYFIEEKLGDELEEAVLFFKDKKRSEDITRMKAKLQEAKKTK